MKKPAACRLFYFRYFLHWKARNDALIIFAIELLKIRLHTIIHEQSSYPSRKIFSKNKHVFRNHFRAALLSGMLVLENDQERLIGKGN